MNPRKARRSPGRRAKDQVIPTLKRLTAWSLAAIGALLLVWNAVVGAVVQGYLQLDKGLSVITAKKDGDK